MVYNPQTKKKGVKENETLLKIDSMVMGAFERIRFSKAELNSIHRKRKETQLHKIVNKWILTQENTSIRN